MHFYRKCWFDHFEEQFMSPILSDCPSLMLGIAIHCIQHSQAMLERGVCELAHSFFHFLSESRRGSKFEWSGWEWDKSGGHEPEEYGGSGKNSLRSVTHRCKNTWIEEMEGSHNNTLSRIDTCHFHQKSIWISNPVYIHVLHIIFYIERVRRRRREEEAVMRKRRKMWWKVLGRMKRKTR